MYNQKVNILTSSINIFNMGTSISIESHTWFDRLPTEIIYLRMILFFFSQRFNNLLLKNQRYLNYFEFPTTNLNRRNKIFYQ